MSGSTKRETKTVRYYADLCPGWTTWQFLPYLSVEASKKPPNGWVRVAVDVELPTLEDIDEFAEGKVVEIQGPEAPGPEAA